MFTSAACEWEINIDPRIPSRAHRERLLTDQQHIQCQSPQQVEPKLPAPPAGGDTFCTDWSGTFHLVAVQFKTK